MSGRRLRSSFPRLLHASLLAVLALAFASPARAVGPIVLDRLPVVLEEHFPNVPSAIAPKGFDVLATRDTAQLVVYLRNDGAAPATNVVMQIPGQPGIVFPPAPVSFGTILPGARVGRLVRILLQNASMGMHAVPAFVSADAYFTPITIPLFVWDVSVTVENLGGGVTAVSGQTPFALHRYHSTAPEVYQAGLPAFFDLQALRDTIDWVVPFYGLHWGQMKLTESERPLTTARAVPNEVLNFRQCLAAQDADGNPIAGATMRITHSDGRTAACVTAANGECCIENVPTGTFQKCVTPPAVLQRFYSQDCKESIKQQPAPGNESVTLFVYPKIPAATDATQPANGQGRSEGPSRGQSLIAGGLGSAATLILDALAAPTVVTTWFAVLSCAAALTAGGSAGVGGDPAYQDATWVGEENTPPNDPEELTHREIVSANVTLTQPPFFNQGLGLMTDLTFTRVTDQNTYQWTGRDTIFIPQNLFFDIHAINPGLGTYFVDPHDGDGQPLSGSQVQALAWVCGPSDNVVPNGFSMLHDDGIAPDVAPNDARFSGQLPPGVDIATSRLRIIVSRTGFDSTGVPPALALKDVPLQVLGVELPSTGGASFARLQPNPARMTTTASFHLPRPARVTLQVFDLAGREVRRALERQALSSGPHELSIDTSALGAGVYSCRLIVEESGGGGRIERSRRLVVVR